MSVVVMTSVELVALSAMLGGLLWKRAQTNAAARGLQPARVRR